MVSRKICHATFQKCARPLVGSVSRITETDASHQRALAAEKQHACENENDQPAGGDDHEIDFFACGPSRRDPRRRYVARAARSSPLPRNATTHKYADQSAARTGEDHRHSHDARGEGDEDLSLPRDPASEHHPECDTRRHLHQRREVMLIHEGPNGIACGVGRKP